MPERTGEPKNTIRELTRSELQAVSGGDGGGGGGPTCPIPPAPCLPSDPYPLPPVEGLPC
jgi:hypothetical protein